MEKNLAPYKSRVLPLLNPKQLLEMCLIINRRKGPIRVGCLRHSQSQVISSKEMKPSSPGVQGHSSPTPSPLLGVCLPNQPSSTEGLLWRVRQGGGKRWRELEQPRMITLFWYLIHFKENICHLP